MLSKRIDKSAVIIVSGPTGSGKTTLCDLLMKTGQFVHAISVTTREPRPGEVDGVDYHFKTDAEFSEMVAEGSFMEWARVHGKNYRYGTPSAPVLGHICRGEKVLLNKDVQGHKAIKDHFAEGGMLISVPILSIFLRPKNIAVLKRRLTTGGRAGGMSPKMIQQRLLNAHHEMERAGEFDHVITTGTPQEDFKAAMRCIRKFA